MEINPDRHVIIEFLESIKKRQHRLLFLLFSAIIFLFHIWYIRQTNVPVIRNDEYGYWSHAALLTGHDWSEVLENHMNWYSYGYSLVLVPLFLISHDLHTMYKLAIFLNGLFGLLTYLVCTRCANRLFPKARGTMTSLVSFMVCMYSSYITQSQIAWSETFLYLMVWVLLYALLRYVQRPSAVAGLLVSALMGFCYLIHNRTIGIVTAYLILVLFMRLKGAIGWKQFWLLLAPLLAILFVNVRVKTFLCMMEGYGLKPKNGLGAQKEHLLSLLTSDGWRNLILALSGQLWCLCSSTFGLVFWGLVRCVSRSVCARPERPSKAHRLFYLFALLASVGTFLISAISLIDPASITDLGHNTDISYFLYTRYDECIVGILLLLGFMELAERKKDLRFVLLSCIGILLYAGMSILLHGNLARVTDTWHYRSFCVAGIGFYRLLTEDFSMGASLLIAALVTISITLLLTFYKKQYHRLHIVLACLLLVAAYIPTGLYSAKIGTIASQKGKLSSGNLAMYDKLKSVIGSSPVYCTLDDTKNFRIAYELQVNLIDTKVYSITLEETPVHESDYFICCSSGQLDWFSGEDYYLLAQSNAYSVLVKGDALADKVQKKLSEPLRRLSSLS